MTPERGEGLELDPAKLISPHGFDGRGPTPPAVTEASRRIARLHTKVLMGGQLTTEEVDDLFAACGLTAEWLREVHEARDALLTAAPQSSEGRIAELEAELAEAKATLALWAPTVDAALHPTGSNARYVVIQDDAASALGGQPDE